MICKCLRAQPRCNICVFVCVMWLFASQGVYWPVTRSWIFAFLCTVRWCLPIFGITSQNIDTILTSDKEVPRSTHIFMTFRSWLKFRTIPTTSVTCENVCFKSQFVRRFTPGIDRVHYGQLNDREGVTWQQLKLLDKSTKLFHSQALEIFRPFT